VQNFTANRWALTDSLGYFTLKVKAGDTLVFSAEGYFYNVAVIYDSMLMRKPYQAFFMDHLVYAINDANVFSLGTYKDFKQKFAQLDLSKDKTEILRRNLQQEVLLVAREAYKNQQDKQKLQGGVGVGVPILTPQEQERLKLKAIMATENRRNQVYQKYNPELIKKVTGIKDDDEIMAFMRFCGFTDNFILDQNQYDLVVLIARKYEEFCRLRKGSGFQIKDLLPFQAGRIISDATS